MKCWTLGIVTTLVIVAGCGESGTPTGLLERAVSPPLLTLAGDDVVRTPFDAYFGETSRELIKGTARERGGCRFPIKYQLAQYRMRRNRLAEIKFSTCEAVLSVREEPYNAHAMAQQVSFTALPRSSTSSTMDFSESSQSSSLNYGPATSVVGTATQLLVARMGIMAPEETRNQLTITYSTSGGCVQSGYMTNKLRWQRHSEFAWGVLNMTMPFASGGPCSEMQVHGTGDLGSGASDPYHCGYNYGFHTAYDNWIYIQPSTRVATFYYYFDFETGGCYMYGEALGSYS
jgi:hypothetical protein